MRFVIPSSLINKIRRSHSKKSYDREKLLVYDDDQAERLFEKGYWGSTPGGCEEVWVGKEGHDQNKYWVPLKYFNHPKLQELIKKHELFVVERRYGEPIELHESCSTETFEEVLHDIVKDRKWRSNH